MPTDTPAPVSVRGGAGGIEAHYDDMLSLARLFARASGELAEVTVQMQRYVLDPGLAGGGLVDPVGAAAVEARLALAVDGPGGLAWLAMRCAASNVKLRAAAAAYEAQDEVLSRMRPFARSVLELPVAVGAATATTVRTRDPAAGLQRFATADPELVDDVMNAVGGPDGRLENGLSAAVLDGAPIVRPLGDDPVPVATSPPRSLKDVMSGLELRSNARHGAVDVRILERPGGERSVIVDIPGTKSWTPLPNGDITSLATNLRALRGASTGYERGVLRAMQQAGVRATDQVMLVGHSEGGMVALSTAIDAHATGRFHVTHVVTAGSPIGAFVDRVPADVEVLALENKHDVVPHFDGRPNAPRPNVTTVTFDRDGHSIGTNHDWEHSYVPGAADADAARDPSIRAFLAGAAPFFDAERVRTRRFVITRKH